MGARYEESRIQNEESGVWEAPQCAESDPLHHSKIEGMGELDGEGAVHFAGIAGLIAEIVQDDKQIISRTVDVVEPDTVSNHVTGTVVLDSGTG
jgi:hypothetical protein